MASSLHAMLLRKPEYAAHPSRLAPSFQVMQDACGSITARGAFHSVCTEGFSPGRSRKQVKDPGFHEVRQGLLFLFSSIT